MGAVYEAEHLNTGERVALKTMLVGRADKQFVDRFRREARAFAKIGGEHVVRVIDADTAPELDGAPFLVMELLSGTDLARMLEAQGRLPPELVVRYLTQTAAAIERAHAAGLIHRDLKPDNIFVHHTVEGREIVKVLDFGIVKAVEDSVITKPGELVGTPQYMAPEQARGDAGAVCPQTDVWALGMIALELMTGEPYWSATSIVGLFRKITSEPMVPPRTRWPSLPEGVDAWFARSCAREVHLRWPSVREQMDALRDTVGATAHVAEPAPANVAVRPAAPMPSNAPNAPNAPNDRRLVGWDAAGVLLLCVAGVTIASFAQRDARPSDAVAVVLSASASPTTTPSSQPLALADLPPDTTAESTVDAAAGERDPAAKRRKPRPDTASSPPAAAPRAATEQELGFLTISSYPWAKVTEGALVLCAATPCSRIALTPGVHTLQLENPDANVRQSTTVTIKSGETTSRAISMK